MLIDLQQFRASFENKVEELLNSKTVNSGFLMKKNYANNKYN